MTFQIYLDQIYEYSYISFLILCVIVVAQIFMRTGSKVGSQMVTLVFRLMLLVYTALLGVDFCWVIFSFHTHMHAVIFTLELLQAIIISVFTYIGCLFAELYIDIRRMEKKHNRLILAIPMMFAISISGIATMGSTGLIRQGNGIPRGSWLYVLIYLIDFFYVIYALVNIISKLLLSSIKTERRKYFVMIECICYPAVAAFASIFIPYTPLVAGGMMLTIIIIILESQNSNIYTDALTGMNNRAKVLDFIERHWKNCSQTNPFTIYMLDLNRFKEINDKYGHLEGDHALVTVAEVLKAESYHGLVAGRYGGDEFIMVDTVGSDPELVRSNIKKALEDKVKSLELPYPLTISVGWCSCTDPDTSFTDIQKKADEECYRDKMLYYESVLGGTYDREGRGIRKSIQSLLQENVGSGQAKKKK